MFHEAKFFDNGLPELSADERMILREEVKLRTTDLMFTKYLAGKDVDPAWLRAMRNTIFGEQIWLTAEELVEQRSGIVKQLLP